MNNRYHRSKTLSASEDEKQERRKCFSLEARCNSKTSDYDLGLFPDRIKGRLVVKFKTSSFLSEDSTRGASAFSQLFCKLITGKSYHIHPQRQTALFCSARGRWWCWGAGFAMRQLPLQEPSFCWTEPAMHAHFNIYALISVLRLPERTPLCDHWLLFWPPPWEKGWGCCPEPWRPHQTSQAQYFCCSYQANEQSVQSLGSTFSFLLTLRTSFFHHVLWYGHPFP